MTQVGEDFFDFDPTKVVASFETFPKGEYELVVGTPKAFAKTAAAGTEKEHASYGIMYPLTIAQPDEYAGKRTFYRTYYQSEGAQSMAKQFMMACLGYGKGKPEEERFDRDMRGKDWRFNPNTGDVGEAYREMEGQRVIGQLDVQKNINSGDDMQNYKGWRTLTSGPIGG